MIDISSASLRLTFTHFQRVQRVELVFRDESMTGRGVIIIVVTIIVKHSLDALQVK